MFAEVGTFIYVNKYICMVSAKWMLEETSKSESESVFLLLSHKWGNVFATAARTVVLLKKQKNNNDIKKINNISKR